MKLLALFLPILACLLAVYYIDNKTCAQHTLDAESYRLHGAHESALTSFQRCASLEPQNSVAQFNYGRQLLQLRHFERALAPLRFALESQPNAEILSAIATAHINTGNNAAALPVLEREITSRLRVDWSRLLAAPTAFRPADWAMAGDLAVRAVERLLAALLALQRLEEAYLVYDVLIAATGDHPEMMARAAGFAASVGRVSDSLTWAMRATAHGLQHGTRDADTAVNITKTHGLLLATQGLDDMAAAMARQLLQSVNISQVERHLATYCGLGSRSLRLGEHMSYPRRTMLSVVRHCTTQQDVLKGMLALGANVNASNSQGWTPLLHAAALGDARVLEGVLAAHPNVLATTVHGANAIHLAAMRGNYWLIPTLVKAGVSSKAEDKYKRTPRIVGCKHMWAAVEINSALGVKSQCNTVPLTLRTPYKNKRAFGDANGGWALPRSAALTEVATCDIDVREGVSAQELVVEYLSLEKPVLLRNAVSQISALRKAFAVARLKSVGANITVESGSMPHAIAFGLPSNMHTIADFVSYMKNTPERDADYVYHTLPSGSELLRHFRVPKSLEPEETGIRVDTTRLALGSAGSGSPFHFHGPAFHSLVYGAKLWFLQPPPLASVSKVHIHRWYRDVYPGLRGAERPLECLQEAGDVMLLPAHWGHGVLNLAESVGLSAEFTWGGSDPSFSL